MTKKYTYEDLYYTHSTTKLMNELIKRGIKYYQFNAIIKGHKTRDREVLEKLMDLLDHTCGFDTREVCIEYIEIVGLDTEEYPTNKFTNLEDLFNHLGVDVSVDDREYYKYTLKENKNETNN